MDGAAVTKLEVVHRSTSAIMRVADSVIDEPGPAEVRGALPTLTFAPSRAAMVEQTAAIVRAACEENRSGHLCLVCRSKAGAQALHKELAEWLADLGLPVRLGHNANFEFTPGVTVSNSRQIKGLEFDSVVVFDPSPHDYRADLDGKRALYMVVTRAKDQLHFVAQSSVSSLLERAISQGFVEVQSLPSIPPVELTPEDDEPF